MFTLASIFILAQLASFANAQEIIQVPNWVVPYEGPKEWQASVGDTMVFTWQGGHNVFIHPSLTCNIQGAIPVGFQSGTEYVFQPEDAGTLMFFSCDIGQGAHCRFGQSLTVMVYSGPAPGGSGVVPDEVITDPPVVEIATEPPQPEVLPEVEPETLPEGEPETLPEVEPEPETLPEVEPTMTDTESSESMSAASMNAVVSLAGLMGAGLAMVLL